MKRFLSLVLVIVLLATLMAPSAFATGEGASASLTAASGATGEKVSATLSLAGFAPATTAYVKFTLDSGLTLVASDSAWELSGVTDLTNKSGTWATQADEMVDINCNIMTLVFTVPEPTDGKTAYSYTCLVKAQDDDGNLTQATATGTVNVVNPATSLEISQTSLELDLNGAASADLSATVTPSNTTEKLTWSSSKESVATVSGGKVTAVAAGEATITAKIGSLSKECAVTVICSHDLQKTDAADSTCQVKGNNAYYTCSVCDKVFADADGENETTVDAQKLPLIDCKGGTATCTKKAVCDMCGKEYGQLAEHVFETILSHDANSHWYACSNEDCSEKKADASHTFAADAEDYTWADDYSSCTVAGVCECGETKEVAAAITSDTTPATCGVDGKTVYTATFDATWAKTQTATKVLTATGNHTYEATGYTWSDSYEACTASGKCSVCSGETTAEATVTSDTTDNNCGYNGQTVYTAAFNVSWAETQTKTVILAATGNHNYVAGDYVWGENNSTCTVVGTCSVCQTTKSAEAQVNSEVTKEPTCIDTGVKTFTADFEETWAVDQTTTSVIPATGNHIADGVWQKDDTDHWQGCTTANCAAELEKAAHTFVWVVDVAATEDATGLKHEECECGAKRSENTVIDKLPHQHIQIAHHDAVAATCVAEGNVEYWTCGSTKCDGKYYGDDACQILRDTIVVPVNPENHGESELRDVKAPTCYQSGYTGNKCCKDCDAVTEYGTTVEPTGNHIADGVWQKDDTNHWQGCTTDGCTAQVNKTVHTHVAEYSWTGYTACAAVGTCECGHEETDTAVITSQTTAATCGKDGKTVYTATFTKSWASVQTTEEVLPATGNHTYKIKDYLWTETADGYDCAAVGICGVCEGTTEVVGTVSADKTAETCGANGQIVYTATFTGVSWTQKQEKTVVLPATGNHNYSVSGEYTWADDLSSCTVAGICSVCQKNTTATAQIDSKVTKEPTCIHEGVKTYTAEFAETWAATQTATKPVAATGVHTGGTEWKTDDDNHWHICTTDGCTEIVDKAAHNFQWVEDKAATEDETGLKHEECDCGFKRSENTVIDKLPHKHIEIQHHAAVAATCVAEGHVEYWTCGSHKCSGIYYANADCTQSYEDIVLAIDPENHGQTELRFYTLPNCYKPGYSGDTYCLDCEKVVTYGGTLNPTGEHTAATAWKFDENNHWNACTTNGCEAILNKTAHTFSWVVDLAATEDETGLKHEECDCGFKRSENTVIDKLPHKHIEIKHHDAVAATCVAEGNVEYWTCGSAKCENKYYGDDACQILLETIVVSVDATNHGELVVKDALDATCSEGGYTGDTYCTDCEQLVQKGSEVAATGKHKPAKKYLSDSKQHWQECSHCGTVVESTQAQHNFKWIVDKQPTETATGLKHEQCTVCDYTRNEKTAIAKLDHAPYKVAAKDATCTEAGRTEHFYCAGCGNYYASSNGKLGNQIQYSDVVVAATGHTFDQKWLSDENSHWHVCHCGETDTPVEHVFKLTGAIAATKDAEGYTGDMVCAACGFVGATGESTAVGTVVEVKDEKGEIVMVSPTVDLVITPAAEANTAQNISVEAAATLVDAAAELTAEDTKLSELIPELVAEAESKGLDADAVDGMTVVDVFDVTILDKELEEYLSVEGNTLDLTIEADVPADLEVFVMVFKENKWQLIENVVNNGDGTITCTFAHFCPVAILTAPAAAAEDGEPEAPVVISPAPEVESAPEESAEGSFPWWIILIAVIVVIGGAVLVVCKKRRIR